MDTLEAADAPFRITSPIDHITKLDDGSVLVHCVVTSETPDSQGEIVDYDAFKAAAPDLMKWATLGEMHDPERMDAGTILKLYFDDAARKVEADLHVVDPTAIRKVLSRTYKAVSIGGVKLATRLVDVAGKTYRKITRLMAEEISLVNRGANPDAAISKQFVLAKKADMDEQPIGADVDLNETRTPEQIAADTTREMLAKAEAPLAKIYGSVADLPQAVRDKYDAKGQAAFLAAFNAAFKEYDGDEGKAMAVAHTAAQGVTKVKKTAKAAAEAADTEEKKPAFPGAKPPFGAKKAKKMKKAESPELLEEKRLRKEADRIRKMRKARATIAKEEQRLAKNDALDAGHDALEAVGEAMQEEQKEQTDGSDESKDLANLQAADEALHEFTTDEASEPDEMGKQYKALRKRADQLRKTRKALAVMAKEGKRIAKIGARNSAGDSKLHGVIHDAVVKLNPAVCAPVAKTETETVAPIAKSEAPEVPAPDQVEIMRKALEGVIPADKLAAIEASLTAQGEQIAKIAKASAGGGPATAYAPVFRGSEVVDDATAFAKAAELTNDPRLKETLGQEAAMRQIKHSRQ
jgi:cation transport regulator ChaB